ncbi:hypothetical protein BpHYR1_040745 [Brachionus plicatilis]|uniref:Uncharacterized protein n=1 Tax=Brachionus plicatilis TaxID=10195 RepID=A0A3M7PK82_BRAPC|nr:hypothetical protein BpHYR1_040745 [Brachionus plicatilis]
MSISSEIHFHFFMSDSYIETRCNETIFISFFIALVPVIQALVVWRLIIPMFDCRRLRNFCIRNSTIEEFRIYPEDGERS